MWSEQFDVHIQRITTTSLVMEHVGLGTGRLYSGSWSQWSASDQPIAVGGPNP